MTPDDIDGVLSAEDTIEPTPNFAKNVMDAVHRAAAEPPPVPFPRLRFGLGLVACLTAAFAASTLSSELSLNSTGLTSLSGTAGELGLAVVVVLVSLAVPFALRLRTLIEKEWR